MADRGLSIDGQKYRNIEDEVAALKVRFGMSDAEWDALPDIKNQRTWAQLMAQHGK